MEKSVNKSVIMVIGKKVRAATAALFFVGIVNLICESGRVGRDGKRL